MPTDHELRPLPGTSDPTDWSCGVVMYACPIEGDVAALKFMIATDKGSAVAFTASVDLDRPSELHFNQVHWFIRTMQMIVDQATDALKHAKRIEKMMDERRVELHGVLTGDGGEP